MGMIFGELILCCLLPGTLEGDHNSCDGSTDRNAWSAASTLVSPEDRPAEIPERRQEVSAGNRDRSSKAGERPGKKLRRGLTSSWPPRGPDLFTLSPPHGPLPSVTTVLTRGIRLQI